MSCTFFYIVYSVYFHTIPFTGLFLQAARKKAIMIYLLFFACDSIFRVINLQEHIFNVACYDIVLFCIGKKSTYLCLFGKLTLHYVGKKQ